ncbi:hypothetical protein [Halospeciosus flavus]|uniref:Uncharacterized protein n=1 Tax=Halospeciosus flavus TaxID=3032283 RepID=A0ABD5Z0L9_9EURY|nr:hypothetical protein [Halospeciosus flavus]
MIGSTGLAGCLSSINGSAGCARPATVEAKKADLTKSEAEEISPINFEQVTLEEQEILETAVEEGQYKRCLDDVEYTPEPLQRLRKRIGEHSQNMHVYLRYDESHYALALIIEDQVYAQFPG